MDNQDYKTLFRERSFRFQQRISQQMAFYDQIAKNWEHCDLQIVDLNGTSFLKGAIELFGPALRQEQAECDLSLIYRASYHPPSGSLIIANRGVVFLAQAPFSKKPFMVCHIAAAIYLPEGGLEVANIGLAGEVYNGGVILRSESACAPSFLLGTQRCNCCYQWMSVRELCAHLNPIDPPPMTNPDEMDDWLKEQFYMEGIRFLPKNPGTGVVMIHLDAQSGMGSGWTPGEFSYDHYSRALLRQLGENQVEYLQHTSIKESYKNLGLPADGRLEGNGAGYRLTAILLDFLNVNKNLICLSNNQQKLHFLMQRGYNCQRVKSLGQVLPSGLRVAQQRCEDFGHHDIGKEIITFEDEIERLTSLFAKAESSF